MAFIGVALIIGLTSNLHCIGMCGPIALALPVKDKNRYTAIFLYNLGRISTYIFIGLIIGLLGSGFNMIGIQKQVSIGTGILILSYVLFPYLFAKIKFFSENKFLKYIRKKIGQYFNKGSYTSYLSIGLLNGLLPCGMVYLAVSGALVQTSITNSILFMFFFGLATLPTMFFIPIIGNQINLSFRQKINKALPYFLVVLGVLFILRGMNLGIKYISPAFNENPIEANGCYE